MVMTSSKSGRTPKSAFAFQQLVKSLQRFGEVEELTENLFMVDGREMLLAAFNSQAYFESKGYYWFSLAKTKYERLRSQQKDHAWVVLLCGETSQFFIPFQEVELLVSKMPPNRQDGRWDLYIRFEEGRAYFGVTRLRNHVDATSQMDRFEQLWRNPGVAEAYADEAVVIPDALPPADRELVQVLRTIRDTSQSRYVKQLYDYRCQVCEWTAFSPKLKNQWYCEAHHLQPLAKRYGGPDHASNIVALCPNHHCMMDLGIMAIEPRSLKIVSIAPSEPSWRESLLVQKQHGLNPSFLHFHFSHIYIQGASAEHAVSEDMPDF